MANATAMANIWMKVNWQASYYAIPGQVDAYGYYLNELL